MASADFTIADVLAWARTKPADEGYPYFNAHECALAQYSLAKGLPVFNPQRSVAENYSSLGKHLIAEPQTFGGLVIRLEALCPKTPVTQSNWSAIDAYLSDIEVMAS